MKKVSHILKRKGSNVISITPDITVIDALKMMDEKNMGSMVVKENGKYIGIVTERDYSRKVILHGKNSSETKVADIMCTDLPVISPADKIEHRMELMTTKNIRYLPVMENNKLTGIISMSDVVRETILAQKETISHLQSYIQS